MIYVIILHTLGQGGILTNSISGSFHFYVGWTIEIFAFCSVNIFGIISGYVKYDENKEYHFKLKNYLNLWLEVAFYNVVVAVILIYTNIVPNEGYLTMFFPLTTNAYWYFTAFTGVMVLSPIVDLGLRAMSKKQAFVLMVSLFILISFFGTIAPIFSLENGYSVIWLLVCYIIGGVIKKCKYGILIKWQLALIMILVLGLLTLVYAKYGITFDLGRLHINKNTFINYSSPTMLASAILYLILFSKLNIKSKYSKYISALSGNVFAAYLINTNYYVFNYIMLNAFVFLLNLSVIYMIGIVIIFSIIFVIFSAFIDKLRVKLFKLCKVSKLLNAIEFKFLKWLNKTC